MVTLESLFASDGINPNEDIDASDLLAEADVIVARDVMSLHETLVYGRDTVERIAAGEELPAQLLKVDIDFETDDLEKLLALVQVAKGHHDYRSAGAQ